VVPYWLEAEIHCYILITLCVVIQWQWVSLTQLWVLLQALVTCPRHWQTRVYVKEIHLGVASPPLEFWAARCCKPALQGLHQGLRGQLPEWPSPQARRQVA
jgi:hypothetical protein